MLLTEKEAGERWCPFARYVEKGWGAYNRIEGDDRDSDGASPCIGSNCMAWRWGKRRVKQDHTLEEVGFCGMAGKPD